MLTKINYLLEISYQNIMFKNVFNKISLSKSSQEKLKKTLQLNYDLNSDFNCMSKIKWLARMYISEYSMVFQFFSNVKNSQLQFETNETV